MYKCIICNNSFQLLKNHLKQTHKMTLDEYFQQHPEEIKPYYIYFDSSSDERRKYSPNTIEFYLNKGFSNEESELMIDQYRNKLPYRLKTANQSQVGYWMKKGFTEEEANSKVSLFQRRSKDSYIEKHGEKEGVDKYNNFLESLKQRKESEIINKQLKFGLNYEEAEQLFIQQRIDSSPRRIEYWLNKGYNEEEAKDKVSEYQDNFSIEFIMNKYNISFEEACIKQEGFIEKIINTLVENGNMIPLEERPEYDQYNFLVWKETNKNYRYFYNFINPLNLKRSSDSYHLDHKFSIFNGFKNKIDYKIIGSPYNLEMLPFHDNLCKSSKNSIEMNKLLTLYNENFLNIK